MGGWVVGWLGGWGEIEIKTKLSPAKAGAWAELGNKNSGLPKLLRWSHALHSDQHANAKRISKYITDCEVRLN
jgi:hypothetical protein